MEDFTTVFAFLRQPDHGYLLEDMNNRHIPEKLAEMRNMLAHGSNAEFTDEHLTGFVVARTLTFAMSFKKIGFDDEKIREVCFRLFGMG
ncbi:MAG: hypothetical protein FWE48_05610 [Coriobacteriia bacterium]|nr:hypothetical protein [Coriobacteriia bacterium]